MLEGIHALKRTSPGRARGALGLMLIDGDEIDEVFEDTGHAVARLHRGRRAGTAIGIGLGQATPCEGSGLKKGEHVFVLADDPSRIKASPSRDLALVLVYWRRTGKGWLGLSDDGKSLPYGPCDVAVGSAERLIYEGKILLKDELEHSAAQSVIGGKRVVRSQLITFAEKHAPGCCTDKLLAGSKGQSGVRCPADRAQGGLQGQEARRGGCVECR